MQGRDPANGGGFEARQLGAWSQATRAFVLRTTEPAQTEACDHAHLAVDVDGQSVGRGLDHVALDRAILVAKQEAHRAADRAALLELQDRLFDGGAPLRIDATDREQSA